MQDIDLICKTYGTLASRVGSRLILGEVKTCRDSCDHSASRPESRATLEMEFKESGVFGIIDEAMRHRWPDEYAGFYLISLDHEDPHSSEWIYVNGQRVTVEQYHALVLECEQIVPPLKLEAVWR